jgi:Cyclin M transmembrane N-terminal domain
MDVCPGTWAYLNSIAASNSTIISADSISNLFKAFEFDGSKCRHAYIHENKNSYYETGLKFRSLRTASILGPSDEHNGNLTAIFMVVLCLICAGLASGLTQGLLSLDLMEMTIKSRSGTTSERMYASKVLPVISRHHLLLVTLMLWNASATEALPVFLSCVVPEYLAIIMSVTMILFVGEIIPTAILTGPKQLQIAAGLVPLVYLVNVLFFPVAYPISLVLDFVLGKEEGMTVYTKREIATLMVIQHEEVNVDSYSLR